MQFSSLLKSKSCLANCELYKLSCGGVYWQSSLAQLSMQAVWLLFYNYGTSNSYHDMAGVFVIYISRLQTSTWKWNLFKAAQCRFVETWVKIRTFRVAEEPNLLNSCFLDKFHTTCKWYMHINLARKSRLYSTQYF